MAKQLQEYAKKNDLKIIGAGDYKTFYDEGFIDLTPYEWVDLFRNAEKVITGTFHGTVFSIKYNKSVLCYRQHGNNVIGAKRISIRKKIQMICQQNGSPRAKMIDEIIRLYGQDMKKEMLSKYKTFASYPKSIKAKNYFFKQSTENVFSTRELQKAKLRILFGSL